MNNLDNYFLKFNEKILFLTLKKVEINNRNYLNLDLPVYAVNLIDDIKNNNLLNSVSKEHFFEGIILLNGINKYFSNIEIINEFLYDSKIDIISFISNKIKYDYKNYDELVYNILLLRGGEQLNKLNFNLEKFYCKLLIDIVDSVDSEYYNIIKSELKNKINSLYNKDPDDPYINLMYGDIYKKESLYIKSKISYEKALKNSQNNQFYNFLRKNIDDIFVKAEIEQILIDLKGFKFENIFKSLEIIKKRNLDGDDYYWIGFIHYKLNEFDLAINYFEKAISLDVNYLNLFLELGISYYKTNSFHEAIRIYNLALKSYPDEENLLFNKILINLKLNNIEDVKKDIDRLLLYEDLNIHIMNDILYLKNLYNLD